MRGRFGIDLMHTQMPTLGNSVVFRGSMGTAKPGIPSWSRGSGGGAAPSLPEGLRFPRGQSSRYGFDRETGEVLDLSWPRRSKLPAVRSEHSVDLGMPRGDAQVQAPWAKRSGSKVGLAGRRKQVGVVEAARSGDLGDGYTMRDLVQVNPLFSRTKPSILTTPLSQLTPQQLNQRRAYARFRRAQRGGT